MSINTTIGICEIITKYAMVYHGSKTKKGMCQFIINGGFGDIKMVEGGNLQFNWMATLSLVIVKDAMLMPHRRLMAF